MRRRWFWLVLAGVVLLAGAFLAREGWAFWQERAARQALAAGHFDEAQRHIDQALRVRADRGSTQLLAARIARLRGAYAEAEQHLSRCEQRDGVSQPLQLEWLLLRCQRGQLDELEQAQLAARANRPDAESAAILEALARVFMEQNRYLEALRCLDRWVGLAPDTVRALDWRGWVCNQLDHRGQALSDYERVLELEPGRPGIRLRLAEILVDSSRHADALPHLERLHEEQPDNPDVAVLLARCRIVQTRTDEARALLDAVLEAHPGHFPALLYRGIVELDAQHPVEAERWLRQALERKPRDPEARYALWRSLKLQPNRQREAEETLARWKLDRQAQDRLIRLVRTELDRNPNDPEVASEMGKLFLLLGEEERGVFWLRRALRRDPRHAPSLRLLIDHYERTHNPARAAEYRQQLDALGP
jgi:tetratricopeptide (TPR) repeat protein